MISVLLVTAIVLLDQNSGMPLGFLLPLATFVIPIRLLDHPSGMVELSLFAIGQRQSAQIRLVSVAVAISDRCHGPGTDHAVQLALAAAIRRVILTAMSVTIAVELQLQLQKLAKIGGGGRRRRRVRRQAATGRTRGTGVGVGIRD